MARTPTKSHSSPPPKPTRKTTASNVVVAPADKIIGEGITFDDVLMVPMRSDVLPSDVSTAGRLTRRIELAIPLVSAAMDTVTESALAIALARQGGIGIVHKNLPIERQVAEVEAVKRSANGVIQDPITLAPDATIGEARKMMSEQKISGLPVLADARWWGILTNRDLRFHRDPEVRVSEVMTKQKLVTAPAAAPRSTRRGTSCAATRSRSSSSSTTACAARPDHDEGHQELAEFPNAARDARGRLRVGAAVGVKDDGSRHGVGRSRRRRARRRHRARPQRRTSSTPCAASRPCTTRRRRGQHRTTTAAKRELIDGRRRRHQGRHRSGLDLHHAHRRRCRCAADHGGARAVRKCAPPACR
jgi:IMP dehydrogenase/GMP reductase